MEYRLRPRVSWSLYIYIYIYIPNNPIKQGVTLSQFCKRCLTGFRSEFSFSKSGFHTKGKDPSLSYNLLIVGRILVVCIDFWRVIALFKGQTASFTIWIHFLRWDPLNHAEHPSLSVCLSLCLSLFLSLFLSLSLSIYIYIYIYKLLFYIWIQACMCVCVCVCVCEASLWKDFV